MFTPHPPKKKSKPKRNPQNKAHYFGFCNYRADFSSFIPDVQLRVGVDGDAR